MSSSLDTVPSSVEFGAKEQWPPAFDCTGMLSTYPAGTEPTNAAITMFDMTANRPVTLTVGPSTSGNLVSQFVAEGLVVAGHTYQLTLTVTPSGTTDIREAILVLPVPADS